MGSLLELLVGMALLMTVTAGVFTVLNPAHGSFSRELEVADMQQRLRVASDVIYKDLLMAGAGAYAGTRAEPLGRRFAPVLPLRRGLTGGDPSGTYKGDTITVLYVPAAAAQATIGSAMPAQSTSVTLAGCPAADPSCGFSSGMDVLVYDEEGSYDPFTIVNAQGSTLRLQHNLIDNTISYHSGATIAEAVSRTYFLDRATWQLMRYDGGSAAATPVVDHVVGFTVEYYGDPQPPQLTRSPSDPIGPWTTYGPRPPPDAESCLFQMVGGEQVPRLAVFGGGAPLVKLDGSNLTDGPWCPDANDPNRWDADLLRIRRMAVSIRLEAALASLRGPATVMFGGGPAFTNPGTVKSSAKWIPDQELTFQVTPRNLNLGRQRERHPRVRAGCRRADDDADGGARPRACRHHLV